LGRRHQFHPFSQKLKCGWENIWRKFVYINYLNNVSSNFSQDILSSFADDAVQKYKILQIMLLKKYKVLQMTQLKYRFGQTT
jgi:hypothetical protein